MGIESSIDTLKLENDELTMTIINLKKIEKDKRRYDNAKIYKRYCMGGMLMI